MGYLVKRELGSVMQGQGLLPIAVSIIIIAAITEPKGATDTAVRAQGYSSFGGPTCSSINLSTAIAAKGSRMPASKV